MFLFHQTYINISIMLNLTGNALLLDLKPESVSAPFYSRPSSCSALHKKQFFFFSVCISYLLESYIYLIQSKRNRLHHEFICRCPRYLKCNGFQKLHRFLLSPHCSPSCRQTHDYQALNIQTRGKKSLQKKSLEFLVNHSAVDFWSLIRQSGL